MNFTKDVLSPKGEAIIYTVFTFVLFFTKRVSTGRSSKVLTNFIPKIFVKLEPSRVAELHFSYTLTQNTGCQYKALDCSDNHVQTSLKTSFP